MPGVQDGDEAKTPELAHDGAIIDAEVAFLDYGEEERKWLFCLYKLTEQRFTEPHYCPRVDLAYRQMLTNAFERMGRIMRRDLPPDQR
jgi:hypothetical protein